MALNGLGRGQGDEASGEPARVERTTIRQMRSAPTAHQVFSREASKPCKSDGPAAPRNTPLSPGDPSASTRHAKVATLTVMSGIDAGRMFALKGSSIVIGSGSGADVIVDDLYASRRHLRVSCRANEMLMVEDLGSTNGTIVSGATVRACELASGDYVQLGPSLLLRYEVTDSDDAELRRQLYESSIRDPLTRAYNRRYFEDRLATEIAHARRTHDELALLMIDVDRFKEVNDRYGHLVGDRVLCLLTKTIARVTRRGDVLARYGGEKFILLARSTRAETAAALAERIRLAVQTRSFASGEHALTATVSIGVASLAEMEPLDTASALIALADDRVYRAKLSGRNAVCAAT